jgi:hypothetical protein
MTQKPSSPRLSLSTEKTNSGVASFFSDKSVIIEDSDHQHEGMSHPGSKEKFVLNTG